MRKLTAYIIAALTAAFGAYMVHINYELREVNDDLTTIGLNECMKPAVVEPWTEVFYFPADERVRDEVRP